MLEGESEPWGSLFPGTLVQTPADISGGIEFINSQYGFRDVFACIFFFFFADEGLLTHLPFSKVCSCNIRLSFKILCFSNYV